MKKSSASLNLKRNPIFKLNVEAAAVHRKTPGRGYWPTAPPPEGNEGVVAATLLQGPAAPRHVGLPAVARGPADRLRQPGPGRPWRSGMRKNDHSLHSKISNLGTKFTTTRQNDSETFRFITPKTFYSYSLAVSALLRPRLGPGLCQ